MVLIERGRHPRFALGESSTPLADLALERLAARYGLADLHDLATWGRWKASYPELGCGLKRGFSFYFHRRGRGLDRDQQRLLVAASPADAVADTHWLRADVDAFFARRAADEDVELLQETEVEGAQEGDRGVSIEIRSPTGRSALRADWVVDASGPAGVVACALGARPTELASRSSLAFGHFRGVRPLTEVLGPLGADWAAVDPFPGDWAAQHHLLQEGWVYVLRFDDHLVSAGLLSIDAHPVDAAERWRAMLRRYPTLGAQFAEAETVVGIHGAARVQHRIDRSAGERWIALPHTAGFVDPLFSTGIASSLLGVERLARLFETEGRGGPSAAFTSGVRRYRELLDCELTLVDHLVAGAYAARTRPDAFHAHALAYFALVSHAESCQRLDPRDDDCWRGFLTADDPAAVHLVSTSSRRLRGDSLDIDDYQGWIQASIARWDVAGLDRPTAPGLYPADLEVLVERAERLGLEPEVVRAALPRLRGSVSRTASA